MHTLTHSSRFKIALAVLVPGLLLLWLFAVPGVLTPSSYMLVAGVTLGLAGIIVTTFRNAEPTGSMAQLIHEADIAAPAAAAGSGSTSHTGPKA